MKNKKMVVLINPPMTLPENKANSLVIEKFSGDLPSLSILTLASALQDIDGLEPVIFDGNVCRLNHMLSFINDYQKDIICIGLSVITENYHIGLQILEHSRLINPTIIHIVGNDHFSALPELCMKNQKHLIDYGFIGNEVIIGFKKIIKQIITNQVTHTSFPSLVYRYDDKIIVNSERKQKLFNNVNYQLIDRYYNHSKLYNEAFDRQLLKKWFGRDFKKSILIEIARGCIKFKNNNQCSFCSIQSGNIWKNSVKDGKEAWSSIYRAFISGFDVIFITADELLLTFYSLLVDMKKNMPLWFKSISDNEKPILIGYVRAEGLCIEKNVKLLYELGFRILYVGIDSGSKQSIYAMNKAMSYSVDSVEKLYDNNLKSLHLIKKYGLKVDIGFVIGHIGMTTHILNENVEFICNLINETPESIGVLDVNILSPDPGSMDYKFLLDTNFAKKYSDKFKLTISDNDIRDHVSQKWKDQDITSSDDLINDYIQSLMPDICINDLLMAKNKIKKVAQNRGVIFDYD